MEEEQKPAPRSFGRSLRIVDRAIADLRMNPKNARVHTSRQIKQIARSMKEFGVIVPILMDPEDQVIAGHGRLLAARQLGITHVPTICIDHLTDAQITAFMIADNRLTENSEWDKQLLGEQFKILSAAELDFSLEITGFEIAEIDLMIEDLNPASDGPDDPADALPAPSPVRVSRLGDLWQLGKHRVLCGDARSGLSCAALMKTRKAAMVFTDPPYNDPIDGYVAGFGKIHHPEFAMASGEMSESEFTDFLADVFAQLAAHSTDGALHYVCMDWRHAPELLAAARRPYAEFKNLCVWVKNIAGQGSFYRSQHELIFVFKSGKRPHRNNIQLGQYGRYRTNIWKYDRVNSLARTTDEGNLSELHPTIKPVELVADAILDCTARGDVVLDPFLGSGTTVIAAERNGRICYGIELNPHYVDVIVRRWQAFTGQTAVQASTGRLFNEFQEETKNGSRD